MKNNVHTKAGPIYHRLLSYVKPYWLILLLGIIANVLSAVIDAGFTYLMRPLFDKSFVDVDLLFIKQIPWFVLIGVTIRGCINALASYCMTWVARSVIKVLRQGIFAHIVRLPADYYDEAASGQLLSKILYDVEQVAQVSAEALTDFVQNTCLVVGMLTVMFVINWQLSLVFLFSAPFIAIIVNYTNKRVRRISHKVQQSMGDVTEIASEVIDGYRVVRIFGGERYEVNKFNQATESSRKNDMKIAVSKVINVVGVQTITAISIALIVFVAIKLVSVVVVTAGAFMAIIAAMFQLLKPMKTLTTLNATIQRGLAGAESVFCLLDEPIEIEEGTTLAKPAQGVIRFEHVSFAYRHGQEVLSDVDFCMNAGETVALVGHSGSGKTTITSLLPRFYEPTSGKITLDGVAISELSLKSLRAQIALVNQQITLFNDTLYNNISYGRKDVSREEVVSAAKLAYADDFIQQLPHGYETRVGDNGVLLSGGQRQRIAIARAILKDAPILILDEATSALDSESERYIKAALEQVIKNRTTLVVAHRLSTIMQADNIIVMHEGRIVEQGRHEQLLALRGHYASLYQAQPIFSESEEILV